MFIGIEETAEWLKSLGYWAKAASILLNIVIGVFGVVPTVFLSGANAAVFGMLPGFAVSLTGECLAAVVSFYLYRWGFLKISKSLQRRGGWNKLRTLGEQSRIRKAVIIFTARVMPLVPSGIVTLAASISGMPVMDFAIATILGKIPSIAVETIIGHDLIYLQENWARALITVLGLLMILFIIRYPHKHKP